MPGFKRGRSRSVSVRPRKRTKRTRSVFNTRAVFKRVLPKMVTSFAMAKKQSAQLLKMPFIRSPFAPVLRTTFTYPPAPITLTGATIIGDVYQLQLNSLFDFDFSNVFGNAQPLYYDQLLSALGPYKKYRVTAWRVKFIVDNVTTFGAATSKGVDLIVGQGQTAAIDADTFAEIANLPNVQRKQLQWYGGGMAARAVLEINGTPEMFTTVDIKDDSLAAAYNASPSQVIYGYLGARDIASGSGSVLNVMMHAELDAELFDLDAQPS